jgi:hypothetical protein
MIKKLEPVFDTARDRWKVNVPASMRPDRKKLRAYFKTRDAARAYCSDITRLSDSIPAVTPTIVQKAMEAQAILDDHGLDVLQAAHEINAARALLAEHGLDTLQAAREVAAARTIIGDAGTILDAAKQFRAAYDARIASKPFGDAVRLYMDARLDLRNSTRGSYSYTLEKFLLPLHEIVLADITTAQIEAIIADRAPTSRKMHTRNLKVFWKWASSPPREWANMAVTNSLEAVRTSSEEDITVLTPEEATAIMRAAEIEGPAASICFALAIFAGVRRYTEDGEITRLKWGAIGDDYIEIGKSVAKKTSRRLIPICPTLRAWIDATRGDAKKGDLIKPSNWIEVDKSVRRRAGFDVAARILKNPPVPTLGKWRNNVCRHTNASVEVAIGTPLEDLIFKFGHTGTMDILRKNYVGRITKTEALEIKSIFPTIKP